eukprot:CAMPEP_0168732330 /NCGR_PEP_ID=MMETSP0724-20121128/7717_1 /TAXON_ID=265536 /ORGANISM="Amphiprora sp., Strain CCMP467" /LENGTH=78 /DNA_ID=CAMNT_0008779349 /DNA_START=584 /DNA_END=820 /DNA_ORIENTATION=+
MTIGIPHKASRNRKVMRRKKSEQNHDLGVIDWATTLVHASERWGANAWSNDFKRPKQFYRSHRSDVHTSHQSIVGGVA